MRDIAGEQFVKNANSPFTEILSLIIKYEILSESAVKLAYPRQDLLIISHHLNNAVDVMLQGLQEIGNLVAAVDHEKMKDVSIDEVGAFISATCNLIEALNTFGRDVEYSI